MHVGHVAAEHDDGAVTPVISGVGEFERIGARDLELAFLVAAKAQGVQVNVPQAGAGKPKPLEVQAAAPKIGRASCRERV